MKTQFDNAITKLNSWPLQSSASPEPFQNKNLFSRVAAIAILAASFGAAQITWVSPSDPRAANAIPSGVDSLVVCRAQYAGTTYLGAGQDSTCVIAAGGSVVKASASEVATGLATWESTPAPGSMPLAGGTQGVTSIRPCRFQTGRNNYAGYTRSDEMICRSGTTGDVVTSPRFEMLYGFDFSASYRLLSSQSLCLDANPEAGPLVMSGCLTVVQGRTFAYQTIQIEPVATDLYRLRILALPINGCLVAASAFGVQMGDCSSPEARIRIRFANANSMFRLQFETSGNYLQPVLDSLNSPLRQGPLNSTASQTFSLRTLADCARRLTVMNYNVMLLDPTYSSAGQMERGAWIAEALRVQDPGVDVVVLQGMFHYQDGEDGNQYLAYGLKYSPGSIYGAGWYYGTGFAVDKVAMSPRTMSGVAIVSRWPIEVSETNVFNDCKLGTMDCMISRGISYAKINKLGRRYHVFATELQEGENNFNTRRLQLAELRRWIDGMLGSHTDEPVILAGGLNIDMETQQADYESMRSILRADFVNAPRTAGVPVTQPALRWTVDPAVNQIANSRKLPASWKDYLLLADPGPRPVEASYRLRNYRRSESFAMNFGFGGLDGFKHYYELSDHFALIGSFVFNYGTLAPLQMSTVPVTFVPANYSGGSAPVKAYVVIDGEEFQMPVTLELDKTTTHTIQTKKIVAGKGELWQFQSWSNGAGETWNLANLTGPDTFKVYYRRQVQLTATANLANGGSVVGSGWYNEGTQVTISATPNPGFKFIGFTGDVARPDSQVVVEMTAPRNVVANFAIR